MACPFFLPLERLEGGAWPHPSRLPLGNGWRGSCMASETSFQPDERFLHEYCNLGYAAGCPNLPATRECDAVRFSVAKCLNGRVTLNFVFERNHLPFRHGTIEFSKAKQCWMAPHADPRVQKMAECYLDSYLRKCHSADPPAAFGWPTVSGK
jgi:hypothetical protein